jgi:hypothetical protein
MRPEAANKTSAAPLSEEIRSISNCSYHPRRLFTNTAPARSDL